MSRPAGSGGVRNIGDAHAIFTPGWPGWLEHLEESIKRGPESIKGYTVGDNTNKDEAKHPWRMDDEKIAYKGYELAVTHGIKNICVHKGLFPQATAERWPHLLQYAQVGDVGKAAKDWPQLNFIIYHGGYRHAAGGRPEVVSRNSRRLARLVGLRSRRDSREVRRDQRPRRRRPVVRAERQQRAALRPRTEQAHRRRPEQGPLRANEGPVRKERTGALELRHGYVSKPVDWSAFA